MSKNPIRKSIAILCAALMLLTALPVGALGSFETVPHSEADITVVSASSATEPIPETVESAGASLPSRYTVVFRFDETENGSVVIVSGANQNSSTGEYTASGGSTVTLAPVPDEGYRYKSGSIRVYYRESGNEIDVPVDEETFSFVVPDVRAYVRLYAEFEPFTPPPEPHSIGVYYQSGEPTGNTVEVDRETAYAGETVTVTLNMFPGTELSQLYIIKPNGDSADVGLVQVDENTYTFTMPDHDVIVYPVFRVLYYTVTNLLAGLPYPELNYEMTVDKTENLRYGETVTITTETFASLLEIAPAVYYEENGETVYVELSAPEEYLNGNLYIKEYTFSMPAHDVIVDAAAEYQGYRVYREAVGPDGQLLPVGERPVLSCYVNGRSISYNNFHAAPGDTVDFTVIAGGTIERQKWGVRRVYGTWVKDGETETRELELFNVGYADTDASGSFIMPEGEVTIWSEVDYAYFITRSTNGLGELVCDHVKAFPGTLITFTATVTDPTYDYITWTYYSLSGVEIIIPEGQPNVRQFYMPAHDAGMRADFSMPVVSYLSRTWNGTNIVEKEERCGFYRELTWNGGDITIDSTEYDGWWIADRSFNCGYSKFTAEGNVKLILCDGVSLDLGGGLYIPDGSTLTIYGQANDSGKIYSHPVYGAGIGGRSDLIGGNVIIHGGTIHATGGSTSAGIGGGPGNSGIRSVTINGGIITANGSACGAGIGKGMENSLDEVVTINGGTVNANGSDYAAGIGGGENCGSGTITINGGTVTAKGGENGAGIGGGEDGNQRGEITINGGTVTANGGWKGAGIGGGGAGTFRDGGRGGTVRITGGTVTVTAGKYGAGIGGGASVSVFCDSGDGGNVTISGGTVDITVPSGSGAGIGGAAGPDDFGYGGDSGTVRITGGKLTIRMTETRSPGIGGGGCDYKSGGSGPVTITGGETKINIANGESVSQGAGIGGAVEKSQGGDIRILGGVVLIDNNGFGAGIGGGGSEKKPSTAGNGGKVYIKNAFIVTSSYAGAGIGGGGSLVGGGGGGNGGTVTIDSGTVYAISKNKGAGVGGGNDGDGGTLTVNGGYLMAAGGYLDYNYIRDHGLWSEDITGVSPMNQGWINLAYNLIMSFITSGEFAGAGVGGGDDGKGGTATINAGTVIAIGGMNSARAFGHGDGGSGDGSVHVYDNAKVSYGRMNNGTPTELGTALTADRESTCKSYAYARVEPCDHPGGEYSPCGAAGHTVACHYCGFDESIVLPHNYGGSEYVCSDCGYERVKISFDPGEGSGSKAPEWADKGGEYVLPYEKPGFTAPRGYTFLGWSMTGGGEPVYSAGTAITVAENTTLTAVWTDPYSVWVSGIKVNEDNENDILGDGTAWYDPDTRTLTFASPAPLSGLHGDALVYAEGIDLTIAGTADLEYADERLYGYAVYVKDRTLTIEGDITATQDLMYTAMYAKSGIIVSSGSVSVGCHRFGFETEGDFVVNDGITRVEASGGAAALINAQEVRLDSRVLIIECSSNGRDPDEDDLLNASHFLLERGVEVIFVLNGGVMEGQHDEVRKTIRNGAVIERPDPDPVREGMKFAGWYDNAELSDGNETDFDLVPDHDIRIYAKWGAGFSVKKEWKTEQGADLPDSVFAVLQHNTDGEWTTVETVELNEANGWQASFAAADDVNEENYRIRELDADGNAVLDPSSEDASYIASAVFEVDGELVGYEAEYRTEERQTIITNSSVKTYSVELGWDIDRGDQDRPDEIEAVLQRQESRFSWTSLEIVKLNPANGWSGEFRPVPIGHVNDTETYVRYTYRIRLLKPRAEGEEEPADEEEALEEANSRVVHAMFDLDKPFLQNLISQADPNNLWTIDDTIAWVKKELKAVFIPRPQFTASIPTYTDFIGKEIPEHDSLYDVKYNNSSSTNKMSITCTAVLEISIYKRWINFEDNEMPESVWLMLVSKVQEDYAEAVGLEEANIYTPVGTVVYGNQISLMSADVVSDNIKSGLKSLLGSSFAGSLASGLIGIVVKKVTNTGVAIAEASSDGDNPLVQWRVRMGVKKYGSYGVPMDFAGTELITGLMEMAIDAIIKEMQIPKINCPVMYHPILKCWSIKGYGLNIPALDKDYELTCNVINVKVDIGGDDEDFNKISGEKKWENDNGSERPEEIRIHVYVRDGDEREECVGSPITVSSGDGWKWEFEVPKGQLVKPEGEGDDTNIVLKEIEIEEEVPEGYVARYETDAEEKIYNVINTRNAPGNLKIIVSRAEAAAEQSFIFTVRGPFAGANTSGEAALSLQVMIVLAAGETSGSAVIKAMPAGNYVVAESSDWSWRYGDAPSKTVAVNGGNTVEASFDVSIENPYWLDGCGSNGAVPSNASNDMKTAAILPDRDEDKRRYWQNA